MRAWFLFRWTTTGASLRSIAATRLEISLPATSGTGYTWQAEPVAGGFVTQVGEPAFALDNAMPGASGHQVFHFGIAASGTGTLEMHYLRPWEKDSKPAKVFKIMLIVR